MVNKLIASELVRLYDSVKCRQTGKTYAAAHQVKDLIKMGKKAVMVCMNDTNAKRTNKTYDIPTCSMQDILHFQYNYENIVFDPDIGWYVAKVLQANGK